MKHFDFILFIFDPLKDLQQVIANCLVKNVKNDLNNRGIELSLEKYTEHSQASKKELLRKS